MSKGAGKYKKTESIARTPKSLLKSTISSNQSTKSINRKTKKWMIPKK